jgi:hypothetical protein
MSHKEVVIYDLEYTTWPGALERHWSGKDEYREIIRIGAISIDLPPLLVPPLKLEFRMIQTVVA